MTLDEFIKIVVSNAKTRKWLNCTTTVQHEGVAYSIGIKAFGLWVQRIQINGLMSDVSEQKTQKAFTAALTSELRIMMAQQGANK